jgi:alpha-tubulin suppressor-like RCC1 family protein
MACPADAVATDHVGTCTINNVTGTCISGQCTPTAIVPNLAAWGLNGYGELGTGSTSSYVFTPTTINAPKGIVSVTGGDNFGVGLDSNGSVWTWGRNLQGQLGDATFIGTVRTAPTVLNFFGQWMTAVAGGTRHALGLTAWGDVYAWGDNQAGQLGSAGGNTLGTDPRLVTGISNVIALAAGGSHSVALTASGEVWCWGAGGAGRLGNGGTSNSTAPVKSSMPVLARAVAAGSSFTMALGVDGNVYAWGEGTLNELGISGGANVLVPTRIPSLGSIRAIAAGGTHGMALHADGTVYAWGRNYEGEVGIGFTSEAGAGPARVQMAVNTPLTNVVSITMGSIQGAAVRDDGTVWTWGSNTYGALGDSSRVTIPGDNASPGNRAAQVPNLGNVIAISTVSNQVFAVQAFRNVYTWGNNNLGRLGTTKSPIELPLSARPVPVGSNLPPTKAISASCSHTLAVFPESAGGWYTLLLRASTGGVYGAGDGEFGALGDDVTTRSNGWVQVLNIQGASAIAAGKDFGMALTP